MSRVVHLYNYAERLIGGDLGTHYRTLCGCLREDIDDDHTFIVKEVTCEECKEKLGIKPAPVVDEEKKAFAVALVKSYYISYGGDQVCEICEEKTDIHAEDCVVLKAKKYLASIKEAE